MAKRDRASLLIYLTLFVNVFDIAFHVMIGQPESLRIIANTFIVISAVLLLIHNTYRMLFVASLVLYIVLNTLFVLLDGIGTLGALLIAFTVLVGVIIVRRNRTKAMADERE